MAFGSNINSRLSGFSSLGRKFVERIVNHFLPVTEIGLFEFGECDGDIDQAVPRRKPENAKGSGHLKPFCKCGRGSFALVNQNQVRMH